MLSNTNSLRHMSAIEKPKAGFEGGLVGIWCRQVTNANENAPDGRALALIIQPCSLGASAPPPYSDVRECN